VALSFGTGMFLSTNIATCLFGSTVHYLRRVFVDLWWGQLEIRHCNIKARTGSTQDAPPPPLLSLSLSLTLPYTHNSVAAACTKKRKKKKKNKQKTYLQYRIPKLTPK
jgi:hypothetical protein